MSVDYSANFGVGYKIEKVNEKILEYYWEDFGLYITSIVKDFPEGAKLIQFGNYYEGEIEYGLVVMSPFKDGLDVTHIKDYLDDIIDSTGLERNSEFGLVGGLLIW